MAAEGHHFLGMDPRRVIRMQYRAFPHMAGDGVSDGKEMEGHPAYPIRKG
jgi:hypothetical protein